MVFLCSFTWVLWILLGLGNSCSKTGLFSLDAYNHFWVLISFVSAIPKKCFCFVKFCWLMMKCGSYWSNNPHIFLERKYFDFLLPSLFSLLYFMFRFFQCFRGYQVHRGCYVRRARTVSIFLWLFLLLGSFEGFFIYLDLLVFGTLWLKVLSPKPDGSLKTVLQSTSLLDCYNGAYNTD